MKYYGLQFDHQAMFIEINCGEVADHHYCHQCFPMAKVQLQIDEKVNIVLMDFVSDVEA